MSKTDIALWDDTAVTEQPKWENRARIIAHFIRPTDVVLDLGAGDRKLKKYLPRSAGYIPLDCTAALPGTFVVDFNTEFRLPEQKFDVVVAAGFFEYVDELDGFMRKLAAACDGLQLYFTYSYDKGKPQKNAYRKLNGFRTPEEAFAFFAPYTTDLREVLRLANQSLFSARLSTKPEPAGVPSGLINESLRRPLPWQRWRFLNRAS